ncbi:hypothetical protein Q75_03030 [Bacillus coahuilensis p1.1.43]|uniref:Uncharacterized protein n=1 Tax=Bacillus coahuilensis p1.1.43 TaxID=1150625 RepID=A0A147KB87_9BACI|nr:hypothetical protein Q75_03030 [Bacillus coahuilensis p1.1.43]
MIVFTVFIAFLCLTERFASTLTQEGNPVPYLKAISTYEWNNSPYEKIVETKKREDILLGLMARILTVL